MARKRESFGPKYRVKKRRDFLFIQAARRKIRSNTLLFAIVPREPARGRAESGPQSENDTADFQLNREASVSRPAPAAQSSSPASSLVSPSQAPSEPLPSRIGITVTTKVHKRAVRRNRLKRFLREIFRKERRFFQFQADIVVIALEGSTDLDYQAVRSEFRFAMRKAGLLAYRARPPERRQ